MATISPLLRLTLQATNDNPDTWGAVLNTGTIELLEDAFGLATADVTSTDITLNINPDVDNAPHYRRMIIDIIGAPGSAKNVIAPAQITAVNISKMYLVINSTTGGETITFKTSAGAGVVIPAGVAYLVYGDGTDIIAAGVETAGIAAAATLAADSTLFGGFAVGLFARLAQAQTWTKGQVVQRVTLSGGGDITPNLSLSNTFFHELIQAENLAAPTGATNGATFSIFLEQGSGGGAPFSLTFQSNTYMFAGGVAPTLSTTVGDIDYLAFEYVTNAAVGNRWLGTIIKDVVTV